MATVNKVPLVEVSDDLEECRKAFVETVKLEDFFRERHSRPSLKAARGGKREGFYDRKTQERWLAFRSGWNAHNTRECLRAIEKHTVDWIKNFSTATRRPPAVITGCIKK